MLVEMVIDGVDVPEDGTSGDSVADLLVRVADGDQAAFAELYDMLASRVFGLILRIVVDTPTVACGRQRADRVLGRRTNRPALPRHARRIRA